MLMIPPAGGDTFAGNSGFDYESLDGSSVEIGPGDLRQAFFRGWSQVSEPVIAVKAKTFKPVDESAG